MGSARIAFVPQLILVIGAISDDVTAILLAKLQLLGILGGLLLPEEHPASTAQEKQRDKQQGVFGGLAEHYQPEDDASDYQWCAVEPRTCACTCAANSDCR